MMAISFSLVNTFYRLNTIGLAIPLNTLKIANQFFKLYLKKNLNKKMNRDILGILFFKTRNLRLREICKKFDEWIKGYNTYWFVQYFKYNKFRILKKFRDIRHIRTLNIIVPEGKSCKLPPLSCLTDKPVSKIGREMREHPFYPTWEKEAKELQFFVKSYEEDYCRYQFLQDNKIVCNLPSHYSSFPDFNTKMKDINDLPQDIEKYYDRNILYFNKL
jgi:hypothetical protein